MPWQCDGLRPTLVDSTLWLASPATFNDPFDASAFVSLGDHGVAARRKYMFQSLRGTGLSRTARAANASKLMADPTIQGKLQEAYRQRVAALGVCCLAARSARNSLMWSHYAANHTGLALQFYTPGSPSTFCRARPVEYAAKMPRLDPLRKDTRSVDLFEALHHKSAVWSYELSTGS